MKIWKFRRLEGYQKLIHRFRELKEAEEEEEDEEAEDDDDGGDGDGDGDDAVSYTHLDVYKRQVLQLLLLFPCAYFTFSSLTTKYT